MLHALKSLSFIIAGSCLSFSGFAAQKVYTPPTLPPGASRTTTPAERDDWLQRVQESFDKTQGKQFDLVFDGDSIIAGWDWAGRGLDLWNSRYAKLHAADFGIAGDMVQNVLWRLQRGQLDGIKPKLVVLMIGTNNLTYDDPDQIAAGIKAILDEYAKDAPNAKMLLLGLLPRGAKADDPIRPKITQVNTQMATMADGQRVTYLDLSDKFLLPDGSMNPELFMSDLTHPNAKGYQVWADAMQPEIDKVFPPASLGN